MSATMEDIVHREQTTQVIRGKLLWGYSGHKVQVIRQVTVDVEYGSQKKELLLLIVAGPHC